MKSYTSILEETLEEELFMSNLNTLRIEIDKKYKIKIIFAYKVKRPKNPYIYEFFSTFMFEFKGSELIKMFKISTKTDENLKISFD